MNRLKNTIICFLFLFVFTVFSCVSANAHELIVNGDNPRFSISLETIERAIDGLGHKVTLRKNDDGVLHFQFDETVENVYDIAVFPADCGTAGCTDVIFYADFGAVGKMTSEHINGWNHVANLKRSKAFRSDRIDSGGHVGLTMTVSFLDDSEEDKFAMEAGLFLTEVGMFSVLVENVSKL